MKNKNIYMFISLSDSYFSLKKEPTWTYMQINILKKSYYNEQF